MYGYLMTLSVARVSNIDDKMINEYAEVGGMRIGRENQSYWRKPAPAPLRLPHFPLRSNPDHRGGKPEINCMQQTSWKLTVSGKAAGA
jgi:hypothetical protein